MMTHRVPPPIHLIMVRDASFASCGKLYHMFVAILATRQDLCHHVILPIFKTAQKKDVCEVIEFVGLPLKLKKFCLAGIAPAITPCRRGNAPISAEGVSTWLRQLDRLRPIENKGMYYEYSK